MNKKKMNNHKPKKTESPTEDKKNTTSTPAPLLQLQQRRENVQADYYLFNGLVNYPALNDDQFYEEMGAAFDGLDRRLSDAEDYFVTVFLPAYEDLARRVKRPGLAGKYRGFATLEECCQKVFGRKYDTLRSRVYRFKLKTGLFVEHKPKRLTSTTSASPYEANHEPTKTTSSKPESSMMDLIVDKTDLLPELAALQGCIASKPALAILASCKLEATLDGEHGMLHLTATDLDMAIRTSCPAHVTRVGAVAVPATKFYDYIRLLPDNPIAIEQLEDGRVSVRLGPSSATSAGSDVDAFPALTPMPDTFVEISGSILRGLIARTSYIVTDEGSRYSPGGAKLIIQPKALAMVATDGVQLAAVAARTPITVTGEVTALIPKKAMAQIKTLLDTIETDVVGFAQDENTLFFQMGPRLLMVNKVAGEFPDYGPVLADKYDGDTLVLNTADFNNAVQRVAEYADSASHAISLNVEGNELSLYAHSPSGESRDSMAVKYSGEPITVRFNALAILNFLKVVGTGDVRVDLKKGHAGRFRSEEHDDYTSRYFLMPMQSEHQEEEADMEKAA